MAQDAFVFGCDILFFRVVKSPYFITLNALAVHVLDGLSLVELVCGADIDQQLGNGIEIEQSAKREVARIELPSTSRPMISARFCKLSLFMPHPLNICSV